MLLSHFFFFFSSRRRHTRCYRDWSSDVCSSDLLSLARRLGDAGVAKPPSERQRAVATDRDERVEPEPLDLVEQPSQRRLVSERRRPRAAEDRPSSWQEP